jgi:hypothetical protein
VHYRRLGSQIETDQFDVRDQRRASIVASAVPMAAVVAALIVLLESRN